MELNNVTNIFTITICSIGYIAGILIKFGSLFDILDGGDDMYIPSKVNTHTPDKHTIRDLVMPFIWPITLIVYIITNGYKYFSQVIKMDGSMNWKEEPLPKVSKFVFKSLLDNKEYPVNPYQVGEITHFQLLPDADV